MSFACWIFCLIYTSWSWQYIDFIFYLLCIIILSRACLQKWRLKFAASEFLDGHLMSLSPDVDRKTCFIFPVCLLYKQLNKVDICWVFLVVGATWSIKVENWWFFAIVSVLTSWNHLKRNHGLIKWPRFMLNLCSLKKRGYYIP